MSWGRALAVPNLLTRPRIVAVPLVVACMYWQALLAGDMWLRWVALTIFIAAGITDILDGYFCPQPPAAAPELAACSI